MKKMIALLLVLLMALPLAALAEIDDTIYTEGTLYYTIANESITIVGCFGKDEEVTVPAMIAGIPVNTIATGAFWENTYIKKLNLPDTISKIEEDAIAEGIYVIYNANTDHPQDYPTDLILGNLNPVTETPTPVPEPTTEIGSGTGEVPGTPAATTAATQKPTSAATKKPTAAATKKPTSTPKATAAPVSDTPTPNMGEVDVDLTEDDTPTPTEAPVTAAPVAEATAAPITDETVTAAPEPQPTEAPEAPEQPETPVEPAKQPKSLTWLWVALGAVAAGGATAGVVAAKKGKKK